MKLAKIVMLVAVAVLLTGGTALAQPLTITIDAPLDPGTKQPGPIQITIQGNENPNSNDSPNVNVGAGIDTKTREKMDQSAVGMSKLKDSGMIVISNPCAWVYVGGRWYWRCW